MATPSSIPANSIRRHYTELANTIAVAPNLLLSLSMKFYEYSFIDVPAKSSINRSGGLTGANVLLDYVMIRIDQSDQCIPAVMEILKKEVALNDIVQKIEKNDTVESVMPMLTPPLSPVVSFNNLPDCTSADTLSSAEKLKTSFASLCFLAMSILSQSFQVSIGHLSWY